MVKSSHAEPFLALVSLPCLRIELILPLRELQQIVLEGLNDFKCSVTNPKSRIHQLPRFEALWPDYFILLFRFTLQSVRERLEPQRIFRDSIVIFLFVLQEERLNMFLDMGVHQ